MQYGNAVAPAPVYMQQQGPGMYYGQPGVIAVQPAGQQMVQQMPVQHMGSMGHMGQTTVTNAPKENKAFSELRAMAATAESVYKLATQSPPNFFRDVNQRTKMIQQLQELNTHLEDLTIKMSVSHRSLIADPNFRGELLVTANKIQRMLGGVKDLKGPTKSKGSCCCTKVIEGGPYLDDAKVKAACEELGSKVASFKGGDAFKLDLNTTGGVSVTGETTANYEAGGVSMTESNTDQVANVQMTAQGQYYG